MLSTLHTLLRSAPNRSDEKTGDHFAFIIIDQKIRQKNQSLKTARQALAALIEAEQKERNQIALIEERVSALCVQTKDALSSGKKELAKQVAHSIAAMENELKAKYATANQVGSRIERLRHSVDSANRQIIDLKQGALTAKAAQREHCNQACLNSPLTGYSAIEKAETLIAKVIGADDGATQNEIPSDNIHPLDHSSLSEQLVENGLGSKGRTTAQDVIERLIVQ